MRPPGAYEDDFLILRDRLRVALKALEAILNDTVRISAEDEAHRALAAIRPGLSP